MPKLPSGVYNEIESRILNLKDVDYGGIKMCIYGESGTGKTRFMSTFATLGPLLHMVCSSNGLNESRSIQGTKNISVIEIKEPSDLPALVKLAKSGKYKTVALDHVTGFTDLVLARILKLDRLPEQSSWGLAKREQYGQLGLQVKNYLRELFDLQCNIIVIGQERDYTKTKESEASPDIETEAVMPYVSVASTPTIAGWIAPAVDFFCRTYKRSKTIEKKQGDKIITKVTHEKEFCLLTGPDTVFLTKFRVPPGTELPYVVVDPTYADLAYLIDP